MLQLSVNQVMLEEQCSLIQKSKTQVNDLLLKIIYGVLFCCLYGKIGLGSIF